MNYVREKKHHVTIERVFHFVTKTNTSADQGQLMKAFETMKANCVIFNKLEGKRESYFVTNTYVNS